MSFKVIKKWNLSLVFFMLRTFISKIIINKEYTILMPESLQKYILFLDYRDWVLLNALK